MAFMTRFPKVLAAATCLLVSAAHAGAQNDGSADTSSFPKPKLVVPTNSTYSKYHMDLSKVKSTRAAPELTTPAVTRSTTTAKPKPKAAAAPPRVSYRGSSSSGAKVSAAAADSSEGEASLASGISADAAMAVSGAGAFSVTASKPAAPARSATGSGGGGVSGSSASSGPQCSITPTDGAILKCDNFWNNAGYVSECKKKASNCAIGKNSVCTPGAGDNGRGLFISCL